MRIAYVTDHLLPRTATDAEQSLSSIAAMGRQGAHVDLVLPAHPWRAAPSAEAIARFYEVSPDFHVVPVRGAVPTFRGLEKVVHAAASVRHAAVQRADVLYSRNLPTVIAALRLGRTPVVYETYRPWPDQHPRRAPLFRWIFGHPLFRGAVLHSELAAASYRRIGARDEQLLVAHNGYDPERLQPVLTTAQAREQTGLPSDRPTVTYAGHVSMDKGLGLVLDMAEALPGVQVVLVGSKGDGPVETRAGGLDNVRIVPWQPFAATVPYLYAADVLLIPPTRGPLERVGNTVLPMKTFLYAATGRAILGPALPDLQEVLADGLSARLVSPDRLDLAVSSLRALLAAPELRLEMGRAAQRGVQTWDARARDVLRFLDARLSSA